MSDTYGKEFTYFYNKQWGFWGERNWNFICSYFNGQDFYPETWLDLCCGAGSLLHFVDEEGIYCVGIDNSHHQLAYAHRNAPSAELLLQDVRKFSVNNTKFDVVTSLFDSLNYITKKNEFLSILKNVRKHMSDKGYFIFDINIVEGWRNAWEHNVIFREEEKFLAVENTFDEKTCLGTILVTGFVKDKSSYKRFEEKHIERVYHEPEIDEMLEKAGFKFEKIDGNRLKPPVKRSGRMMYICRLKK